MNALSFQLVRQWNAHCVTNVCKCVTIGAQWKYATDAGVAPRRRALPTHRRHSRLELRQVPPRFAEKTA